MESTEERIQKLKKEKDAVILAHYYTDGQVQAVADYVGDSYYLSKIANEVSNRVIVLCGVYFMGESAKILNPEKTVILADKLADCPMAHMVTGEKIRKIREEYQDVAVVCYVNSAAEIKALSDVCVTSSNALKIVKALPNQYIYFVPDRNLGRYISEMVPEKKVILNEGFCPVHDRITAEQVERAKKKYPEAVVLAHPECRWDVLKMADYIGSTSGIINFAVKSLSDEFIICTEMGVLYELEQKCPGKKFYPAGENQSCEGMKRVTVEKILEQLEREDNVVEQRGNEFDKANQALAKMLELAK
ncbi:MAG: quinolinate synthase NadA [Oscillospiraceae bacterium]